MRVAAALVVYAGLLAVAGPWVLRQGRWASRAPWLGILAWQGLSAAFLLALTLTGLALAVPSASLSGSLAQLLRSCAMAIRAAYSSPGGAAMAGTGLVLAGGVIARVGWCTARVLLRTRAHRDGHCDGLALVGRFDATLGVTVLDTAAASAYCVPGRTRHIVVTTGALTALQPDELTAVLAHERAHLIGRHHLILAAARALAEAFPRVPLLTLAGQEVARLVEMLADDRATRGLPRRTVASALLVLADTCAPAAALAAGGPTTLRRVRRLMSPAAPLGVLRTLMAGTLLAVVLATPVAAAVAPGTQVAGMRHCDLTMTASRAEKGTGGATPYEFY